MAPNPNAAPILFDRPLLRARQQRALRDGPASFLLERVAEDAAERLQAVLRQFNSAADIGTPGDQLRNALAGRLGQLARIELPDRESEPLALGAEQLDLAVSALAFQFVNDLPGVLAQIRRALKPDGFLLAAMIGGDTLTELRESFAAAEAELESGVSPRVAPFVDLRDVGSLLQRAGFALPVADVDRIVVRYASAFALMADLRRMGATNVLVERRRTPTRRATHAADGADLRRTLRRCRWPHPRHLRCDLAVGLGAASEPAAATQAGIGEGEPGGCGEGGEARVIVSDRHCRAKARSASSR